MSLVQRFERRAATLAGLNHPNLARLLGYGIYDNQPYLVSEYVANGKTLSKAFEELGPGKPFCRTGS